MGPEIRSQGHEPELLARESMSQRLEATAFSSSTSRSAAPQGTSSADSSRTCSDLLHPAEPAPHATAAGIDRNTGS
jgi:hypothetical protein